MLNIEAILFPTDFSEAAEAASVHAVHLARRFDAALHVLHVAPSAEGGSDVLEESRRISRVVKSGVSTTRVQVQDRPVPDGILDYAEDHAVDLIVMGTHGRTGIGRLVMGSVAEAVVRKAPCPVFAVRAKEDDPSKPQQDDAPAPETKAGDVERILVPIDFSASSVAAFKHARALAIAYGASLDLLYISPQPDFKAPAAVDAKSSGLSRRRREQAQLEALVEAAHLKEAGVEAAVHVEYSYPDGGILRFARREDTDLIVMATHGRTGLKRFPMGSVAERVIRQAPCPVFVVKSFGKLLVSMSREHGASSSEFSAQP